MRRAVKPRQTVVTAWAEHCSGPGWSNSVVWVILRDGDGRLTQECLQPGDATSDMLTMFPVSDCANRTMSGEAAKVLAKRGG